MAAGGQSDRFRILDALTSQKPNSFERESVPGDRVKRLALLRSRHNGRSTPAMKHNPLAQLIAAWWLLPLGRSSCRSAVTHLQFPAVAQFGTCVDCSRRITNVIILNSLRCSTEDSAPELICAQRKRKKRWPVSQRDLQQEKRHRRACP